jgi:hypothetical protein
MPIAFTNQTQALTYRKVAEYLTTSELFKNTVRSTDDQPKFNLIYGSTKVGIRVLGWEVNPWETPERSFAPVVALRLAVTSPPNSPSIYCEKICECGLEPFN